MKFNLIKIALFDANDKFMSSTWRYADSKNDISYEHKKFTAGKNFRRSKIFLYYKKNGVTKFIKEY